MRKVESTRSGSASTRGMSEEDPAIDVAYAHDDEDEEEDEEEEEGPVEEEGANKQARLMRACDNCRRKKVKCNGTKPSCSHCTRMKLACHYSPLVRKKRVRRSIIDKLEERLESMEQMLQPLVERLSPNDPVIGAGGFGLGFGFAPAPPPAIAHPLGLPYQGQVQHAQFALQQLQQSSSSSPPPPVLPPPHVIEELMEIAITRMTPTAPPVSWTQLVRRLHSGQLPEYIVCATVALAARFSNRPEFICTPRYNAGREYARRAAELVAGLVDRPDPDVVFCLVMLSLYEWGCGRGESAWTYTGMATRLAQRCRLHLIDEEDFNENAGEQDRSWANTEWRRRLWWHVYCGDRTSVIVASRPATMHDDDCVVDLPTHDHEWITGTLPETSVAESKFPDSWWLVVELYRACSRISEFVNRRRRPQRSSDIPRRAMFDILDGELEEIRSKFVPYMSEFPPQAPWLLSGYAKLVTTDMGISNICAIYFNIHLMYHAAKIILYRSELPEYQHESVSPEHIQRAKQVCTESAHQQAEVIRWALDSVPIEDWDPRVGVWSLQGASIHVNAALSDDNLVAEQSRRDLEVHLKLHVASDQYYHFNMAIITMLHHVFNLRKKQRLAITGDPIAIHHENDSDPWIVPRCSSFLGFTYNYSQLRGILNDAIKQTTYSPPDAITDSHPLTISSALMDRGLEFDLSGGLWHPPAIAYSPAPSYPDEGPSTAKRSLATDTKPIPAKPPKPTKGRKSAPPVQPAGTQQLEKLQRLEELRARVVLLQQLSGTQPSSSVPLPFAGTPAVSSAGGDVNGFLSNFAASIGSTANQLGSQGISVPSLPSSCAIPTTSSLHPSHMDWLSGYPTSGVQTMDTEELQTLLSQIGYKDE
ncbi:hypothetical protein GGH94_001007 [Coemansia aciculifera]|uniref:Zn(2)-C6 fungal-type domain-containing protein n=1 Tax=Coemansia aciculifera TaxID=417176 RepID=A0A9W8M8K7_9FUNG|nr:hypothetical protein GGH94_001007 [Coemansia aciculifera]